MQYSRNGAGRHKPGVEELALHELAAAVETLGRRLELMHGDQRLVLEKLTRLRLVVDSMRDEQRRLADLVANRRTDALKD